VCCAAKHDISADGEGLTADGVSVVQQWLILWEGGWVVGGGTGGRSRGVLGLPSGNWRRYGTRYCVNLMSRVT